MAIVDELITIFSFKQGKGSKKELKELNNAISSVRKKALLAGAALSGFAIATTKIVQGVDQQAKFAKAIGVSFETLRKLQFAAKKAGASTSELDSFMGNLAKTIVSLQPGQFNRALQLLGVKARDTAGNIRPLDKVILNISNNLKKFGAIRRLQLVGELGGGTNITNFLNQSPEKIARDMEEAVTTGFVIPERLAGQFAEFFDDSLLKLRSTIQGFTEVMIASLLPAITKIVDELEEWILKNKELLATDIGDFLKGAGEGFAFLGKSIKLALDVMTAIIKPLLGVNEGLSTARALGFAAAASVGALAIAATLAARSWLILGGAIAGTFALVKQAKDTIGKVPFLTRGIPATPQELAATLPPGFLAGSSISGFKAIAPNSQETNNTRNSPTQNNTFNISGALDPREVAKQVKEALELPTALQTSSPGYNRPQVA